MKNIKRILAIILCAMMLVTALPLTSFAAYENTHVNTGNQIEDLIAVATTQIGYTEGNSTSQHGGTSGGSGNYTKYGAWYGINPGAWCAMFVSWCANQAGISSSIIPKHASCDIGMQTFQQRGCFQWSKACGGSYQPKRGDIIYFRTKTNQVTDSTHVGIIYSADASTIYTIEGNASNKCQKKSYSTSSAYIIGYGTPNYTSGSAGYVTGQYKVTASSLNMRDAASSSGTNVLQALPTNAVVDVTLVYGNWGYCSYNGISGWIHLGYTVYIGSGGGSTTSTYTITFDPGNGTIATGASSYQISAGMPYAQVMADMPTATRNGYRFDGWYCAEYNYTFNINDTFSVTKDVTFTAVWTPVYGVYEVTAYNLNMRSGAGSSYGVVQVLSNGDQINVTKIDDKWGYGTFNGVSGWFSLNYCTYVGEGFEGYILTFNPNGGTMPEGYSTTYEFLADEKFSEVIWGFPVPTKEGYEFKGWQWNNMSSHFWTDGWGTQPYTFGQNITLDAVWEAHTCNFTLAGTTKATCTEPGVTTYSCTCGESYTEESAALGHSYTTTTTAATCTENGKSVTLCTRCGDAATTTTPSLGHDWGAWQVTTAPTALTKGVETRTCKRCPTKETREVASTKAWKISFDADGGKMPADVETVYGINTNENYKDATGIEYPVPTLDGYVFDGWYWETYNFTLTKGDWDTGYFAVSMDVEFIALWSEAPVVPDEGTPAVAGVNNYTVTLNGITDIKEIRYAIGHYTTGAEVRAAEKNQTLSAALVNSYTVNGTMTYEVPWVGEYTFWVRLNDGSQYFVYADVNDITPYLEADGLKLTVKDFGENYKDMWIAEGTWNSYSEIKNNVAAGAKYQAAATKLSNYFANHDFTYTTADPGAHTVLIRYNDGTQDVMHIDLTVDVPTFDVNGLQVIVGNIPGVKIIRTAYGEYNSVAEIKGASGVRNFNNKTAIRDAESYRIQYRDNGVVTIIVEYATGYKHVEHINIQQKTSTLTQNGSKITIGNFDEGLVMVRYAEGTYKTSNGVKNAAGSRYVKADAVVNGQIVFDLPQKGTWTVCVQYDDESFNFYYVEIK